MSVRGEKESATMKQKIIEEVNKIIKNISRYDGGEKSNCRRVRSRSDDRYSEGQIRYRACCNVIDERA